MKAALKRKRIPTLISFLLLAGTASTLIIGLAACKPGVMNADQISEWRQNYPTYSQVFYDGESKSTLDMILKTTANAYVFAKVVEHLPDKIYSATPEADSALSAILAKQGLATLDVACEEMKIKILDVVYQGDAGSRLNEDLRIEAGQVITVSTATNIAEYYPDLAVGMKIMMPLIIRGRSGLGYDYAYSCEGLYYVVKNNYVLSAFESQAGDYADFDGLTIEEFSKSLIEIRNTPSKWNIEPYD